MHRRPEVDMLPLDTEIEITLQNLRRITNAESKNMANTSAESINMKNQRERLQAIPKEEEVVERNQRPNTMEDFWRPIIQQEYSTVRQPAI